MDAYVLEGVRTPIGRHGGGLSGVRPDDLAALVVRTAVERARPRPVTPHYTNFTAAFREVVQYAREHAGELPPGATRTLADALRGLR